MTAWPRMMVGLLVIVAASMLGCQPGTETKKDDSDTEPVLHSLRILVIDDAQLATTVQRQWKANSDQPVRVSQLPATRLAEVRQLAADVVIFPSVELGTLCERQLLQPLRPETLNEPQLAIRDIFELQRRVEVRWGEQTYAVSMGSPQLVLLYRHDVFEQLQLKVPSTWQEYEQVVAKLTAANRQSEGALQPVPSPVIEPLADAWAGKLLLARAAAYARHPSQFSVLFDYETMEPLIAGPPFVKALRDLLAVAKLCGTDAQRLTPMAAKKQLLAGDAWLVLAWPSRAATDSAKRRSNGSAPLPVGVAPLPGANEAFNIGEQTWSKRSSEDAVAVPLLGIAGRLGGVTKEAAYPHEAAAALCWLGGKKWSPQVAAQSAAATLYRKSHLEKPAIWTDPGLSAEASRDYVEAVATTQSQPAHVTILRIPGHHRYMQALDGAVVSVCTGKQTPAAALAGVADQWRSITDEIGREPQRRAYMRSLGLEP